MSCGPIATSSEEQFKCQRIRAFALSEEYGTGLLIRAQSGKIGPIQGLQVNDET
jgi:hypothetical protein